MSAMTMTSALPTRFTLGTVMLGLAMLATGASGLIAEYVLATMSTYIMGSSIENFSLIIGSMLGMMAVAGYVQKYINDNHLIEKFVGIELLLTLIISTAPFAIYATFGLARDYYVFVQQFYIMAIGFLIGLEIPLAARVNERYAATLKANLSVIIGADYIGSFLGALLWTKVLLRVMPLTQVGFVVAGFNFAVAIITYIVFVRKGVVPFRPWIAICSLLLSGLLIGGFTNVVNWSLKLEQQMYKDPIVYSHTTAYQHLVLTRHARTNAMYLYINGRTQFCTADEAIYHESLVHPAMILTPHSKVLILGGGDGMALREVLKYKDVEEVVLVDLDPGMIKLFRDTPELAQLNDHSFADARVTTCESLGVEQGETQTLVMEDLPYGKKVVPTDVTVSVVNIDADKFLDKTIGNYDVIIIDLPDPNCIELCKLYSKEFYLKLHRHLSPHGMVVVQATSPYHAKEAYLCIERTIQAAGWKTLPYHDNVPSFGEWGWFMFWHDDRTRELVTRQIQELEVLPVETNYLSANVLKGDLEFGKGWLISDQPTTINTLMEPKLLDIYLHYSWLID